MTDDTTPDGLVPVDQPHLIESEDTVTWSPPDHLRLEVSPTKLIKFLSHLAVHGNVTSAVKSAGVSRSTVYYVRKNCVSFEEAWDEAMESAKDVLDAEIQRRAVQGVVRPIYQGGKKVGQVREFSDKLLELRAKAVDPRYRQTVGKIDVRAGAVAGASAAASAGPPVPPVERTEDMEEGQMTLGESIQKLAEIAAANQILPEAMRVEREEEPPDPEDVARLHVELGVDDDDEES